METWLLSTKNGNGTGGQLFKAIGHYFTGPWSSMWSTAKHGVFSSEMILNLVDLSNISHVDMVVHL